jgi:hypothetical protein
MKLGLVRRFAAGAAILLGAGTLAACLPGGGDPPPPPWCHPTGIALLESSLIDAARLGLDDVVDVIIWKLDQCDGGTTDGGSDGSDGGGGGGSQKCEAFANIVEKLEEQLQSNPGNQGLQNALEKAEARLAECAA